MDVQRHGSIQWSAKTAFGANFMLFHNFMFGSLFDIAFLYTHFPLLASHEINICS
jgi:hypothetical protein